VKDVSKGLGREPHGLRPSKVGFFGKTKDTAKVLSKGQATGDLLERYGCHKVRRSVEKFLKEESNQRNEL